MSWKNILKKDYSSIHKNVESIELTNKIINPLNDYLNSKLVMDGDYDEEKGGYYDSEGVELYLAYPDGKITVTPMHTESDGLVTDYNIYYNYFRLGSYTGEEGHYLAVGDWGDEHLDDLKELAEDLETYMGEDL